MEHFPDLGELGLAKPGNPFADGGVAELAGAAALVQGLVNASVVQ